MPEPFRLDDDQHLVGMDDKSRLSINGARVADVLVRAVPDLVLFRTVLRVIKRWAKRRGIYSNVHGYLGGFSWSILVAYVCRHKASPTAAETLVAFFRTFAFWNWATDPVALLPQVSGHALGVADWKTDTRRAATMTVLTAVLPNTNSTFTVGPTTVQLVTSELKRGHECFSRCTFHGYNDFMALLDRVCAVAPFFSTYRSYIEVMLRAPDRDALSHWFISLSLSPLCAAQ